MRVPEPRYVRTQDGTYLAYQVVGDGPVDFAWQFDFSGNLDCVWERPVLSSWFELLTSFCRVILHDRRGTGLSSRDRPPPNLETRADDLVCVLDHVGSERTVIGAAFEGMAPGVLLAATDPDRVRGLAWWYPSPRTLWAPDYPWGESADEVQHELHALEQWGTVAYGENWADDWVDTMGQGRPSEEEIRAAAKASRNTCTPDVALELNRMWLETDLRAVLPSVRVPALLFVDKNEAREREVGEYVAGLMPAAEVAWVSGAYPARDQVISYLGHQLEVVRRFVGLEPVRTDLDSVLATVLFTDIVDSTQRQAALGDHAWKGLVEQHHVLVRDALTMWRGVENDTAGDGFYATFDGPARAIRCALQISERVGALGLQVRAGLHVGECEVIDGKVGGIAVSIGARIAALAHPSQVLVSQTVKDLVAGSGLTFADAGEHELKGVPDRWHVYAVAG